MKKKYLPALIITFIINANTFAQISLTPKSDSESEFTPYIKGTIQFDGIVDFQETGVKAGFVTPSISIPQVNRTTGIFSVQQSQIGFGVKQKEGKDNISAYVEIDFFGPNGTTAPRFRKAYFTYKKWLVGQTWSNFTDTEIAPNVFDFMGQEGLISTRRVQIRYTTPLSEKQNLSLSLEDPNAPSITLPIDSLNWKEKSTIPSFTVMYRYGNAKNYVKIGGIVTPISYEMRRAIEDPYTTKNLVGVGGMISGKMYLGESDNVSIQSSFGKGFASNNVDLNGEGYDAFPDPEMQNKIKLLNDFNVTAIYEHRWSPKWSSLASYSYSSLGNEDFVPANKTKNFQNVIANLIYSPFPKFRVGLEGNYGRLENFGNQSANAFRAQFSTSFSF